MKNEENRNWQEIIRNFRTSGLGARRFSESQGISHHTLNYHIRKERERDNPGKKNDPGFIQLPVNQKPEKNASPEITIHVETGSSTIRIMFSP